AGSGSVSRRAQAGGRPTPPREPSRAQCFKGVGGAHPLLLAERGLNRTSGDGVRGSSPWWSTRRRKRCPKSIDCGADARRVRLLDDRGGGARTDELAALSVPESAGQRGGTMLA